MQSDVECRKIRLLAHPPTQSIVGDEGCAIGTEGPLVLVLWHWAFGPCSLVFGLSSLLFGLANKLKECKPLTPRTITNAQKARQQMRQPSSLWYIRYISSVWAKTKHSRFLHVQLVLVSGIKRNWYNRCLTFLAAGVSDPRWQAWTKIRSSSLDNCTI